MDPKASEPAETDAPPAEHLGAPLFDRRVPPALLDALRPEGLFSWVTELAREPLSAGNDLDLGLRASPKKPRAGEATLHLGTSRALTLRVNARTQFWLEPQRGKAFKGHAPDPRVPWRKWLFLEEIEAADSGLAILQASVKAAISAAPGSYRGEGHFQAALAKWRDHDFTLVDREVQPAFVRDADKAYWMGAVGAPLVQAQRALASEWPWAKNRAEPGGELDALAIDDDGRLLAIEVKLGSSNELAWTPIQVAMYALLLRAWIVVDEAGAKRVLERMAAQRAALGLGPSAARVLQEPIEVVPVIAVGLPLTISRDVLPRFAIVRDAVLKAGEPLTGLELWAIDPDGRITKNSPEFESLLR